MFYLNNFAFTTVLFQILNNGPHLIIDYRILKYMYTCQRMASQ